MSRLLFAGEDISHREIQKLSYKKAVGRYQALATMSKKQAYAEVRGNSAAGRAWLTCLLAQYDLRSHELWELKARLTKDQGEEAFYSSLTKEISALSGKRTQDLVELALRPLAKPARVPGVDAMC